MWVVVGILAVILMLGFNFTFISGVKLIFIVGGAGLGFVFLKGPVGAFFGAVLGWIFVSSLEEKMNQK